MKNNIINTVEDFHKMVQSYNNINAVYRGVQKSSYKLLPRIGRSILENKLKRNQSNYDYIVDNQTEISSLEDFKKLASLYTENKDIHELEWLAIAQHHGLPTRLMDWSRNPLVAAYFACLTNNFSTDATIYVIKDFFKLKIIQKDESVFSITEVKSFHPNHTTQRIIAQDGLFTIHNEPEIEYSNKNMDKWIINKQCIVDIKVMLRTYGINHSSMFPGLDGVAQFTASNYGLI